MWVWELCFDSPGKRRADAPLIISDGKCFPPSQSQPQVSTLDRCLTKTDHLTNPVSMNQPWAALNNVTESYTYNTAIISLVTFILLWKYILEMYIITPDPTEMFHVPSSYFSTAWTNAANILKYWVRDTYEALKLYKTIYFNLIIIIKYCFLFFSTLWVTI